jgi:hypothetical protein
VKATELHNLMRAALVARGFGDLARTPEVVMAMCDAVGEYLRTMGHRDTEDTETESRGNR